jgi:pimeloyl-ACP methyl ester carboxylesterase
VLLFLHGSGPGVTGWRNFRGILPTFAKHFRCPHPGISRFRVSDDFGGHPMVTAYGTVSPFLDALGVEKVHIVGKSMGGGVGINFAIHNPDRVDRLVTIGGIGTNVSVPDRARASGCCRSLSRTRPGSGSSTDSNRCCGPCVLRGSTDRRATAAMHLVGRLGGRLRCWRRRCRGAAGLPAAHHHRLGRGRRTRTTGETHSRLHVAAACSLSECEVTSVASISPGINVETVIGGSLTGRRPRRRSSRGVG